MTDGQKYRMDCLREAIYLLSATKEPISPDDVLALAGRFADFVRGGDADPDRIDGGRTEHCYTFFDDAGDCWDVSLSTLSSEPIADLRRHVNPRRHPEQT